MSASKKTKNPSNLDRRLSQVNFLFKEIKQELSSLEKFEKIAPEGA